MNAGNPNQPPGEDVESESTPHYDDDMNRRVTRLEVVLETVLPTLATKADVAALRAEMKAENTVMRAEMKAENVDFRAAMMAEFAKQTQSLQRWMLTIAVALSVGLGGLTVAVTNVLRHQ